VLGVKTEHVRVITETHHVLGGLPEHVDGGGVADLSMGAEARHRKGSLRIRRSVLFWYFWIGEMTVRLSDVVIRGTRPPAGGLDGEELLHRAFSGTCLLPTDVILFLFA
jgi:hypothetical protein